MGSQVVVATPFPAEGATRIRVEAIRVVVVHTLAAATAVAGEATMAVAAATTVDGVTGTAVTTAEADLGLDSDFTVPRTVTVMVMRRMATVTAARLDITIVGATGFPTQVARLIPTK